MQKREQFLNGFETAIKILKNAEDRKMENANNLNGTKNNIECIKELIGLNIEPLQNEDYSFLKGYKYYACRVCKCQVWRIIKGYALIICITIT